VPNQRSGASCRDFSAPFADGVGSGLGEDGGVTPEVPVTIARETSPRGEVVLRRRGRHLELIVNGAFAMDTVDTSTEEALARIALETVAMPSAVLVGGLGLGFTARAVLADHRVGRLDVVELEQPLVAWAQGALSPSLVPELGHLEDDTRCRLWSADVAAVLAGTAGPSGPWDLVLLDVDNGPDFLLHEGNAGLYAVSGLRAALAQVAPGGALVVWSSHRSPRLMEALATVADEAGGPATERILPVEREGRRLEYALYTVAL
jgi:spermidine synthase